MAADDFQVTGYFNRQISPYIDSQETINMYGIVDPQGKKPLSLARFAGLNQAVELITPPDSSPTRQNYAFEDKMYSLAGDTFFRMDTSEVVTTVDTINTSTGLATMVANNGGQIMLVDGADGWIYDIGGGTLTQITAPGFPPQPLMVAFLDGYFIVTQGNTRQFYISALNDGTQWDALDFAVTQSRPGVLIGCAVVNRRLFLFKADSVEVWYNAGAADFPLRRDNNLLFNLGCAAAGSIAVADYGGKTENKGLLLWISADSSGASSVMMSNGYSIQTVSNAAVDNVIRSLTNVSDARAYTYKSDDGKLFYICNFTTDDLTLVYQIPQENHPESGWLELRMQSSATPIDIIGGPTRHLGDCHAYFNGKHYIGSYKAPILYNMSSDYDSNAGEPILCERTTRHLYDPAYRCLQIKSFQADFQTGIGNVTGDYRYPKAYLSISRDGGITFGNQHRASLGAIGNYGRRVLWRKLGLSLPNRSIVFKLQVYDMVKNVLLTGGAVNYVGLRK